MIELNSKQELANFLKTTIGQVETNFPVVKARALRQGYQITKIGKKDNVKYIIEKVEPQQVPLDFFSTKKIQKWAQDFNNEKWVPVYFDNNYEVSNYGRVRNKKDLTLRKPSLQSNGYYKVSIQNKNYLLHRIVLISFNPIPNFDLYDVDHIDGNRSNNKLENLQFLTSEENTYFMLANRKELNKELTRLLQTYDYNTVLEKLKTL